MAGLTVAVTGPTGEIGRAFMRSLERSRDVGRIVGMARRPFDPAAHGWKRTEYRRGDVLDRGSVEGLVEGADVVVHLAFVVLKASSETRHVNVEGSRGRSRRRG
jgi:UDP-glucose 4-epimerase